MKQGTRVLGTAQTTHGSFLGQEMKTELGDHLTSQRVLSFDTLYSVQVGFDFGHDQRQGQITGLWSIPQFYSVRRKRFVPAFFR